MEAHFVADTVMPCASASFLVQATYLRLSGARFCGAQDSKHGSGHGQQEVPGRQSMVQVMGSKKFRKAKHGSGRGQQRVVGRQIKIQIMDSKKFQGVKTRSRSWATTSCRKTKQNPDHGQQEVPGRQSKVQVMGNMRFRKAKQCSSVDKINAHVRVR